MKKKEITMQDRPVALVTGANKGIGLQIAKDIAARGFTVLVGSRNLEHGEAAALNSLASCDGQRGYGHATDEFVDWYCSEPRLALNRMVVLRYRSYLEARQLAPGTINLRLGGPAA
jgi:NAD(P)-dependent dehydrogenase (short-subunit alcohol dehydrogenase family)